MSPFKKALIDEQMFSGFQVKTTKCLHIYWTLIHEMLGASGFTDSFGSLFKVDLVVAHFQSPIMLWMFWPVRLNKGPCFTVDPTPNSSLTPQCAKCLVRLD